MKKHTIISAFIGLLSLGNSVMAQENFTVKGKITGWQGKYIHLETRGNQVLKDSVENKDGSFEFKGQVHGATNAFLVSKDEQNPVFRFFFLEPGTTTIQGEFDNLSTAQVSGSELSAAYQRIKDIHEVKKAKIDSIYNFIHSEKDQAKVKGYYREIEALNAKDVEDVREFIAANPKNPGAIYELFTISGNVDYPTLSALYNTVDASVRDSEQGKDLKAYVTNLGNIQLGKIAPDFVQPDSTQKEIRLSDFKGKYVLLDFWASWCIPCRKEHPNLLAAYKKYKDKGLEILGVSIDTKEEEWRWKRAIQNDGVIWPQVSDLRAQKNAAAQLYAIQVVPTNFLIDPSGKIIAKNLMGEELNKKLAELLGQ